jgi:hypothetical protein
MKLFFPSAGAAPLAPVEGAIVSLPATASAPAASIAVEAASSTAGICGTVPPPPPRSCPVSGVWQNSPLPTLAWFQPGQCAVSSWRCLGPPSEGWCIAPRCTIDRPRSQWRGSCRHLDSDALDPDPRGYQFSGRPRQSGGPQSPTSC